MVEVAFLARRAKLTIEETLIKMREAGVDSMPGGGAEIFAERVRAIICDHKIDGEEWLTRRGWLISWASSRMRPCSTATLKTTKTASITC